MGGRVAVALDAGKAWLAFATDAPAPRPTQGAAAAARDGVVVVAPSAADLAAAEAAARAPSAKYARATFDKRFAGLPAAAGARVAFDPKVLLAQRSPQAANTALGPLPPRRRRRPDRHGAGAARPVPHHGRPHRAPNLKTCRSPPARSHRRREAAPRSSPGCATRRTPSPSPARRGCCSSSTCSTQLPGFLKPDLTNLGPNGTVTSTSLDLHHLTARFEPPDPGDWATKLGRIDTLAGLAGKAWSSAT